MEAPNGSTDEDVGQQLRDVEATGDAQGRPAASEGVGSFHRRCQQRQQLRNMKADTVSCDAADRDPPQQLRDVNASGDVASQDVLDT